MLTLAEFTTLQLSMENQRKVAGGITITPVGCFESSTGSFDEQVVEYDDGTTSIQYREHGSSSAWMTGDTLLANGDNNVRP